MNANATDLTGKQFGTWYVLDRDYAKENESVTNRNTYWKITCLMCGMEKTVRSDKIARFTDKECACLQ